MAVSETIQARRAALLLHGSSDSLREQVLARLPVADSSRLKPLLAELAALGIPRSEASMARSLVSVPARAPATVVERAEQLHPEAVLQALENCTLATASLLLRAAEWPWKGAILNRMSPALRTKVLDEGKAEHAPLGSAVVQVLCECLCREVTKSSARNRTFGEPMGIRLESIRVDLEQLGSGPRPAAVRWRTGVGLEASRGVGAHLRRLVGWTR